MEAKPKKTKVFLLTYEELERFDHMLTALAQAYWALVTQRAITVPAVEEKSQLRPEEEKFYQLHFDLNQNVDQDPTL
jgi:hypothetical protein